MKHLKINLLADSLHTKLFGFLRFFLKKKAQNCSLAFECAKKKRALFNCDGCSAPFGEGFAARLLLTPARA